MRLEPGTTISSTSRITSSRRESALGASVFAFAVLIAASPTAASAVGPASGGHAPDPAKKITQYVHDVWQTEDGLPANDVQAIVQGREGYLWLATRGGLARFDGLRFEVFNMVSTPAFRIDDFGSLVEAPDGSLWIGSRGAGLYRYRRGIFTAHPGPTAASNDVRALLFDRDGHLWVGTLGGLYRLTDGRLEAVESLDGVDVRALHEDDDGTLWAGSNSSGLFRCRESRCEVFVGAVLADLSVRAILRDRTGDLWIGTAGGLHRYVDGQTTIYRRASGLVDDRIDALHQDAVGSLWIGTDSGFVRFRDGRFEGFVLRADIAADLVRAVYVDREGSLWVGTYGSGLHRFKAGPATAVSELEGLSHNGVWSVYGPPSGGLLVGFGDGGIDRLRDGAATPFGPAAAFPQAAVYSMYQDPGGVLWVGTAAGLVRYAAGRSRVFTTADGLPNDRVRIVYPDPREPDALWLGTFAGVARLRRGEITGYPSLRDNVRALLVDRVGALWVGTESGLVRLEGGEITVFTTADGLGGNAIRALYEDPGGDLWIGTRSGGLARRRGGEITAYTTRQGLPHNDVWAILEDAGGNLWWSSDQGLARARKADFDAYDQERLAAVPARTYGRADGLEIVECNGVGYPSAWKSGEGMLHFASMGGVVAVDPRPPSPGAPPPVYVESLVAGRVPVDLSAGVELEPDRRNLEIAYTSPQLRDPEKARFRYRLVPYDRDWTDAGARRTAFYTNLPPGAYEFRVIAGSEDAGWNENGAVLALELRPHFYETWWFYAACALLMVLAIYLGYRVRTRGIRARNERLRREIGERQQAERERERLIRELEAKNDELERFTYTVSHDLKAPLVTIRGFLGFVKKDAVAVATEPAAIERLDRDVGRIDAAAEKMAGLLEDLLALSRIGRHVNPPEEVAFGELAREAVELVAGAIEARGVEVELAPDLPVVTGDRARLVEVLQNLLDNAVRYLGDQQSPKIEVGVRRDPENVEPVFYVRDNGMGIERKYRDKVFELFQRLDPETEGTGIGLALVKRIVELHGGRIWVESEAVGRGSTFCFTLPGAAGGPPRADAVGEVT